MFTGDAAKCLLVLDALRNEIGILSPKSSSHDLSAIRTSVLLCFVLAEVCLAIQPGEHTTTAARSEDTVNIQQVDPLPEDTITPLWKVEVKPEPISIPDPAYPALTRKTGIEGMTMVMVVVGVTGSVTEAAVYASSGHALLDTSAVEAARKAKFRPGSQGGRPVPVRIFLPFRFALASIQGTAPSSDSTGPDDKGDSAAIPVAARPDLVRLGRPGKYAATYFRVTVVDSPVTPPFRDLDGAERYRNVARGWVSGSQQFLSQVFPGARFLRVLVGGIADRHYECWVHLADGQAFRVAPICQMRKMLAAQSLRFDSSSVDVAAKIAVLFAYCGRRVETSPDSLARHMRVEGEDSREPDSLAFPSVEFRSFKRGAWTSSGKSQYDGMWVDCVIDGVARWVFVMISGNWSSDLYPMGVQSPDVSTHFVWNGPSGGRVGSRLAAHS
jgi:TonB family protein